MIPYYFLIALPVLGWVINKKCRFTFDKKILYETQTVSMDVFMLFFFLLLALRGIDCGIDTKQYFNLFNDYSMQSISRLINTYRHELGYKLLNKLLSTIGGNYQLLLAVTAAICVYPLWYFYKRESENQLLTIALFLTVAPFVMYFSGIRQAITISLGIPAWYCARNKKLVRFILIVILAMQFHKSAFILFAMYPLYHVTITRKWLWFVVPCMLAVFVFKEQLFSVLASFFWSDEVVLTETGATSVLLLLVMFGCYSYIIPSEKKLDRDTTAMRNMLLCSITFQFFAMLHPWAMRFNYYWLIFVPILIPKIIRQSNKKYKQIAELSAVIMTVFFLYYFISNGLKDNDDLNVFPYIPFWQSHWR